MLRGFFIAQSKKGKSELPVCRNSHDLAVALLIVQAAVFGAVFMQQPGDLDIIAAVFGDLGQPSFFVPLERLKSFGGLAHAQSRCRQSIHPQTVGDILFDLLHDIQRRDCGLEIHRVIPHQYGIIELAVIVPHHQIGPLELVDQIHHMRFIINGITAGSRAVGNAHAQPHPVRVVPAAHFGGRTLGFQVKIDDVLHFQYDPATATDGCGNSRQIGLPWLPPGW